MKRIILLCLLVGLVLPGIRHSTAQDSDSPAPYLYYFSEAERGIVIERADGTQIAVAAAWDIEIWNLADLIEAYGEN
ncbi:MAG: hypothetical protein L0154_21525 [Chloroflexi bacterium]|nr:hypothetical protein [Chloroflexota bacterium]